VVAQEAGTMGAADLTSSVETGFFAAYSPAISRVVARGIRKKAILPPNSEPPIGGDPKR
jgi:hypothetical protein